MYLLLPNHSAFQIRAQTTGLNISWVFVSPATDVSLLSEPVWSAWPAPFYFRSFRRGRGSVMTSITGGLRRHVFFFLLLLKFVQFKTSFIGRSVFLPEFVLCCAAVPLLLLLALTYSSGSVAHVSWNVFHSTREWVWRFEPTDHRVECADSVRCSTAVPLLLLLLALTYKLSKWCTWSDYSFSAFWHLANPNHRTHYWLLHWLKY